MTANKVSAVLLLLVLGAGVLLSTAALAADTEEPLTVGSVWLEGETLHIEVSYTDGIIQTLELNLGDYTNNTDEFITVQATDNDGNVSNSVQFRNPFYSPEGPAINTPKPGNEPEVSAEPVIPDGSGAVIENATDEDGKEFFTIESESGGVYYLIIDRYKTGENVYFLNEVTEDDLVPLAQPGDAEASPSAQPTAAPTAAPVNTPEPSAAPAQGSISGGSMVFIAIAALAAGAVGYYIKFVKPKKAAAKDGYDVPDNDYDDYDDEGGDV
jgi:ABC-type cobalt transport system substrate-binding protein